MLSYQGGQETLSGGVKDWWELYGGAASASTAEVKGTDHHLFGEVQAQGLDGESAEGRLSPHLEEGSTSPAGPQRGRG